MRLHIRAAAFLASLAIAGMTGCRANDSAQSAQSSAASTVTTVATASAPASALPLAVAPGQTAESAQGDFVYRLVSEKPVYTEGETVKLYAELEYTGSKKSVKIYHAASPFYFPMQELTRSYEIGYIMPQPLWFTTLKREEPQRKDYPGGGAYSSTDPKPYIDFMERIGKLDFPVGTYVVNGYADFYMESGKSGKTDYLLKGTVTFKVEAA